MSSRVIPKEHLTEFRRWEMSGVEDPVAQTGAVVTSADPAAAGADPVAIELEHAAKLAAELDQQRRAAWDEGFKRGLEAGYSEGYGVGQEAAAADVRRLGELLEALDGERLRQDERLAAEVLQLALAVARQMLRSALQVKEGLVVQIVHEALSSLPSLTGHVRLVVHPADAEVVRNFMEREYGHLAAKVREDSRMERGGFRLESSHNEVDGSVANRWREIVDCLGAEGSWLD